MKVQSSANENHKAAKRPLFRFGNKWEGREGASRESERTAPASVFSSGAKRSPLCIIYENGALRKIQVYTYLSEAWVCEQRWRAVLVIISVQSVVIGRFRYPRLHHSRFKDLWLESELFYYAILFTYVLFITNLFFYTYQVFFFLMLVQIYFFESIYKNN